MSFYYDAEVEVIDSGEWYGKTGIVTEIDGEYITIYFEEEDKYEIFLGEQLIIV
jgi:hypothetical protein